jgi:hypothetical protein
MKTIGALLILSVLSASIMAADVGTCNLWDCGVITANADRKFADDWDCVSFDKDKSINTVQNCPDFSAGPPGRCEVPISNALAAVPCKQSEVIGEKSLKPGM